MKNWLLILGVGALVVFLIAIGPLAMIWSWNTLFGDLVYVNYTVWTWLATAIFMAVMSPTVRITKKS